MLASSGHVRRIIEEDGKMLVSFDSSDAYFSIDDAMRDLFQQAHEDKRLVYFTYDRFMSIKTVSLTS